MSSNEGREEEEVHLLFGWTIEVDENFKNMKKLIQTSLRLTQILFLLIIISLVLGFARAVSSAVVVIVVVILQLIIYIFLWCYFRAAITSNQSICGGCCTRLKASEIFLWLMSIIFLADVISAILAIVESDVIGGVIRLLINCVKLSLSVALILNVRQLSKVYSKVGNDEGGHHMSPDGGEVEC